MWSSQRHLSFSQPQRPVRASIAVQERASKVHRREPAHVNASLATSRRGDEVAGGTSSDERWSRSRETQWRRRQIVDAFRHSWAGYRQYAWGRDEVKPLSNGSNDAWGGFAITMIDALDTAMLMGMHDEAEEAIRWLSANLTLAKSHRISVFEMTIRALGGLIGAYELSDRDPRLLVLARSVADRLLKAFDASGRRPPVSHINMASGRMRSAPERQGNLAEAGSVQLEFARLSVLSPETPAYAVAARSFGALLSSDNLDAVVSLNGAFDSFYEYLLKTYLLTNRTDGTLLRAYRRASYSIRTKLLKQCDNGRGAFLATASGGRSWMEHLACFWPGTLALAVLRGASDAPAADTRAAELLAATCYRTYAESPTGLAPDAWTFETRGCSYRPSARKYSLRPETVESLWYLWRLTRNETYREWGWRIFEAVQRTCRTPSGYAATTNVYDTRRAALEDSEPSFWMAEVLKYLYLLHADDDVLPLDQWVLNTEAHPLRVVASSGGALFASGTTFANAARLLSGGLI